MRTHRERFFPAKSIIGKAYNYKREGNTITGEAVNVQDGVNEAQALYNFGFGMESHVCSSSDSSSGKTIDRTIYFSHETDANKVEEQLKTAKFTKKT